MRKYAGIKKTKGSITAKGLIAVSVGLFS